MVEAEDAIWQKQLFHLRFDILAKLTEVLGSGIVTDLEFRIATAAPRRPPQSAQSHSETVSGRRRRRHPRPCNAHRIQAGAQRKGDRVKITETEVRYVADLANLKLTDSEIARLAKDMDEILTHMDALNELDTSSVEPMAQVLYQSEETATLRADEVIPCPSATKPLSPMRRWPAPDITRFPR